MRIPKEINDGFYAGIRGKVVKFCINDSVKVIEGEYEGEKGAVISVWEVEPEVTLIIETRKGKDIRVKQSFLQFIDYGI